MQAVAAHFASGQSVLNRNVAAGSPYFDSPRKWLKWGVTPPFLGIENGVQKASFRFPFNRGCWAALADEQCRVG